MDEKHVRAVVRNIMYGINRLVNDKETLSNGNNLVNFKVSNILIKTLEDQSDPEIVLLCYILRKSKFIGVLEIEFGIKQDGQLRNPAGETKFQVDKKQWNANHYNFVSRLFELRICDAKITGWNCGGSLPTTATPRTSRPRQLTSNFAEIEMTPVSSSQDANSIVGLKHYSSFSIETLVSSGRERYSNGTLKEAVRENQSTIEQLTSSAENMQNQLESKSRMICQLRSQLSDKADTIRGRC